MLGPSLPISQELHAEKYRGQGESFRESQNRIASTLQDSDDHYQEFRDILLDMRFLAGGRVQSAIGSSKNVTASNCYISGTVDDSFVEGAGSIMMRALEAAATMRQGGGIGYDFSQLRPRGAYIKKLQSHSSGPVAFMEIFDAVCRCVASSGHRRGAQMGCLRVDHPDIEEFVRAKQPTDDQQSLWDLVKKIPDATERMAAWSALQKTLRLTGFNTSVGITHEFMSAVRSGTGFDLRFQGSVHKTIDANALWDLIMRSTWDFAEPGVLFIDTINDWNNLKYCEVIATSNPCGEQPMPPFGACLLGSFNLVKYITGTPFPSHSNFSFDMAQLLKDIPPVVRAMDNIIDRSRYPLYEQEKEAKNKRRMGLGVTGLANALEAVGHAYGSAEFVKLESEILAAIKNACYQASVELAREKGSFPLYDKRYLDSKFVATLDPGVQAEIRKYGIRNSHLTSIAPTGTISLCADNVSSGIEPVFSYAYDRTIQSASGARVEHVTDYGVRVFGVNGKRTQDVTVQEHLDVLLAAAAQVDSAVSKTCNVPGDVKWDDFKNLYVKAYEGGAKGCTTFRIDGKRTGILASKDEPVEETSMCMIMPDGSKSCE